MATWYGNELRGHLTASGVAFDPDGLTAAHRTLPFGTCLTIQNPKTGKTVQVTVNDRGPFIDGLTLDLSAAAAKAIGMTSRQAIAMQPCPTPPTPAPTNTPSTSASPAVSPVADVAGKGNAETRASIR